MSGQIFKNLDFKSVEMIQLISPLKPVVKNMVIAYEGQIPNVAVWVHQGTIAIKKDKSNQPSVSLTVGPVLVFLDQVLNEEAAQVSIEVQEGAKISILDRPTLKKLTLLK